MNGVFTNEEIIELYHRHVDTVYRVCFMFLKNAAETEDAVQNTFLKLLNKPVAFRDEKHERGWLIITAANICKNSLKHWFRNRRNHFEDHAHLLTHEDSYEFELLEHVLLLPRKYKMVIYMYYVEGYSTVEIANLINANESTIRTRLVKGRELLRRIHEEGMQWNMSN